MKIEADLTQDEKDLLCLMMGAATTGFMMDHFGRDAACRCVRVMNKLFALDPDYRPYDETVFDPEKPFPFLPKIPM